MRVTDPERRLFDSVPPIPIRADVSLTDFLAWWGAVISTGVLVWDVVKWRLAGPRLRLTVTSGMESINIPEYEGKMLMNAQVVNRGDRSTTITNLGFLYYKNVWNRLRNRPDRSFIIGTPNTRQPLQYELKPGVTWSGIAIQTDEVEKMAHDGYLTCAVYHSHQNRPVKARVHIK
jgi:hypothetical protein